MASYYIEDKYVEKTLDDGTVAYTRTRHIIEALKYYRSECFKIIEDGEKSIKQTPRLMMVSSFEEAMRRIDKISNTQTKIRKARDLVAKIDSILIKIANSSSQSPISNPDEQSK